MCPVRPSQCALADWWQRITCDSVRSITNWQYINECGVVQHSLGRPPSKTAKKWCILGWSSLTRRWTFPCASTSNGSAELMGCRSLTRMVTVHHASTSDESVELMGCRSLTRVVTVHHASTFSESVVSMGCSSFTREGTFHHSSVSDGSVEWCHTSKTTQVHHGNIRIQSNVKALWLDPPMTITLLLYPWLSSSKH